MKARLQKERTTKQKGIRRQGRRSIGECPATGKHFLSQFNDDFLCFNFILSSLHLPDEFRDSLIFSEQRSLASFALCGQVDSTGFASPRQKYLHVLTDNSQSPFSSFPVIETMPNATVFEKGQCIVSEISMRASSPPTLIARSNRKSLQCNGLAIHLAKLCTRVSRHIRIMRIALKVLDRPSKRLSSKIDLRAEEP